MHTIGRCKRLLFIALENYPYMYPDHVLTGVSKDAQQLFDTLLHHADGPVVHYCWLRDREATKEAILTAIQDLKRAKPTEQILIYFGGHGLRRDGISYLLPSNAHFNSPIMDFISIDELTRVLEQIRAEEIVFILDCCYSGGMLGVFADFGDNLSVQWQKGYIIGTARAGEMVAESTEGGLFMQQFCQALTDPLIANEHGQISVQQAFGWIRDEVKRNALVWAHQQNPVSGGIRRTIYITQVQSLVVGEI